jgi:alkylresorcinol/alkylpyrone synthase
VNKVWLRNAAVAHPEYRVAQEEAARRIGEASGDQRRTAAIARGTRIETRSVILAAETIRGLGSIEARNRIYAEHAPRLALAAVRGLETDIGLEDADMLVTTSCTGYMVPGWDVVLVEEINLKQTAVRLPITEAGCSGGVTALARATDYLCAHPGSRALVVAVEICSLAFHPDSEAGNLTSALLFGDGASAALLESGTSPGSGLEVVDSLSLLVPCSREALGFALTDQGFYPQLTRDLADLLPAPTRDGVTELLARNGVALEDIGFWLVHPGGPRILESIAMTFGRTKQEMRWSWQSLREFGNTSSAAILDVTRRFLADESAPAGWGAVIAFGPGVSVEMLLVRRC